MSKLHPSVIKQLDEIYRNRPGLGYGGTTNAVVTLPNGERFVIDLTTMTPRDVIDNLPPSAFLSAKDRTAIYAAIDEERAYQDNKFGPDKEQSVPGFLVLIQNELTEAMLGWAKDSKGRNSVMHEIRQIAAVCVNAMEKYGTEGNARSTDDIPD